jgi:hypothetical protein
MATTLISYVALFKIFFKGELKNLCPDLKYYCIAHGWVKSTLRQKILTRLDLLSLSFFDSIVVVHEPLR